MTQLPIALIEVVALIELQTGSPDSVTQCGTLVALIERHTNSLVWHTGSSQMTWSGTQVDTQLALIK